MADRYHTIREPAESALKIQGSRFLAFVACAESRDAAMAVVEERRAKFYDASHHAFAYRLSPEGRDFRYFDDGEPAGTAGRPILAAIDHEMLTNVVVVVTRYFGGTKLGIGGLGRAYGEAAAEAIAAAGRVERTIAGTLDVSFPHALVGQVMHVVARGGARVVRSAYDEQVHFTIEAPLAGIEDLYAKLREATSGGIRRDAGQG